MDAMSPTDVLRSFVSPCYCHAVMAAPRERQAGFDLVIPGDVESDCVNWKFQPLCWRARRSPPWQIAREKQTICSTSLRDIASIKLVGNACNAVSQRERPGQCGGAAGAAGCHGHASTGLHKIDRSKPTASGRRGDDFKIDQRLNPMRPTFFMSPVPAMPCTTLAK